MLALFAWESRELVMGNGILCLRARGAGVRRARMLLLEMRSDAVITLLSVTL